MKEVSFEEFDYELSCVSKGEFGFDDKINWFGDFYQNKLSVKENIKLFLEWIKEE